MPTGRIQAFDTGENIPAANKFPGAGSLAAFKEPEAATVQSSLRLIGKRAVAVVYSNYPSDPRPRRAAESMVKEGASVEVICLRETDNQPLRETTNGVEITRIPLQRRRGGKLTYILQYGLFILSAGAMLAGRTLKRRYDLVHVHNMPDILVLSALIPKLFGARVILDLHDPMPELMVTIFGLREDSRSVQLLKKLEAWSIRFADAVLTTNEAFRKRFLTRGCPPQKISVVMNSPDEEIFSYRELSEHNPVARDSTKPFVIMYHGSLVERHGLDLAVTALGKAGISGAELRIYGRSTSFLEQVMASVRKTELVEAVRYLGPMKLEQIPAAIGQSDIGIIPNRRSEFTELNMPTRIFEYLSQGKPVIAPRSPGILDYFGPEDLVLFELGDVDDLAAKMQFVFSNPVQVTKMVERGQKVYKAHRWCGEQRRLINLAENLLLP